MPVRKRDDGMGSTFTILDNTEDGTASAGASGTTLSPTSWRAVSFTAGTDSPTYDIDVLRLGLRAPSGSYTTSITVQLWSVQDLVPTASVTAAVTLYVGFVNATVQYYSFSGSDLGVVGDYHLRQGESYALAVGGVAPFNVSWRTSGAADGMASYGDFAFLGYASSSNAGGSWSFSTFPESLVQIGVAATCFLRGTLILTARGEVAVERLRAGDLVATKFGGLRPIRWIGTQRFEGRLAGAGHQPVRFLAGSLGAGAPSCDLWVSPGHAVLVSGESGDMLAHAGALVNGSTITQARVRGLIEYFHIDLGPHDCVLANGAWAESYFEDRNRDAFHNAGDFHARFPGHVAERQATCLPIVTAESPFIDALRARLAPRPVAMVA